MGVASAGAARAIVRMASNSRRNSTSVATPSLSRRGSCDSETSSVFPNTLKRGKPVSQVKITFMGKPMELMVPMNDDVNIYDGTVVLKRNNKERVMEGGRCDI